MGMFLDAKSNPCQIFGLRVRNSSLSKIAIFFPRRAALYKMQKKWPGTKISQKRKKYKISSFCLSFVESSNLSNGHVFGCKTESQSNF